MVVLKKISQFYCIGLFLYRQKKYSVKNMGQSESSPEDLSQPKGSKESRSSITKMITYGEKIDWSGYDDIDEGFVFDINSEDGKRRLRDLKASISKDVQEKYPELTDFICKACLCFRNGHLPSAATRVQNYLQWRLNFIGSLEEQSLMDDPDLYNFLNSNTLNIIPHADTEGKRAVLLLRLRFLDPTKTAPIIMLRAFHYLVMRVLKEFPEVQTNGLIFINDMDGASFGNMDTRIPKSIMAAISKNLPLRLHKALIVRPIWLLGLLFPIAKLFLSAKMQSRVQNIGGYPAALENHGINMNKLPIELSGKDSEYDHNAKVRRWYQLEQDARVNREKSTKIDRSGQEEDVSQGIEGISLQNGSDGGDVDTN